jgi:hypothetical protein
VFSDTPKRVHDIESVELKHHMKINRLFNVAKSTSLAVDTNSKKLTDIWGSVKNDELRLRDLALKSDLISVFNSLHSFFLASITRLNAFQNAHSSLLLEFEFYLQLDSKNIHECILNKQIFSTVMVFFAVLKTVILHLKMTF